jgi:hypothetical protein
VFPSRPLAVNKKSSSGPGEHLPKSKSFPIEQHLTRARVAHCEATHPPPTSDKSAVLGRQLGFEAAQIDCSRQLNYRELRQLTGSDGTVPLS